MSRKASGPWFVNYIMRDGTATKADLESFIDRGEARDYYEKAIATRADVAAAEDELDKAKRRYAVMNDPNWDPGGNTNNPGRVARAMRERADSGEAVKRAEAAVDAAKKFRAELQAARGLGEGTSS